MTYYADPTKVRYRPHDPERVGTVTTVSLIDGAGLLRCFECGDPVECMWEQAREFAKGILPARCAECRGDKAVLAILHPAPKTVIRRREQRERGITPGEYRRRAA